MNLPEMIQKLQSKTLLPEEMPEVAEFIMTLDSRLSGLVLAAVGPKESFLHGLKFRTEKNTDHLR